MVHNDDQDSDDDDNDIVTMMMMIMSLNDDDDDDYDRIICLSTWDEGRTQALHFNLCNPGIQCTIHLQSSVQSRYNSIQCAIQHC